MVNFLKWSSAHLDGQVESEKYEIRSKSEREEQQMMAIAKILFVPAPQVYEW